MFKKCSKCNIEKSLDCFYKRKAKKDGLRSECKKCTNVDTQKYRKNNRDSVRENNKKSYIKNIEKRLRYAQERRDTTNYNNEYIKRRLKIDPIFRAIFNARNRARTFLREKEKYSKKLGCSGKELKKYLESQFQPGMTWENYGKWELDHKYPLSVAYKEGPEAFAKSCHYTNLQPLWRLDNIKKGNKVCREN